MLVFLLSGHTDNVLSLATSVMSIIKDCIMNGGSFFCIHSHSITAEGILWNRPRVHVLRQPSPQSCPLQSDADGDGRTSGSSIPQQNRGRAPALYVLCGNETTTRSGWFEKL